MPMQLSEYQLVAQPGVYVDSCIIYITSLNTEKVLTGNCSKYPPNYRPYLVLD